MPAAFRPVCLGAARERKVEADERRGSSHARGYDRRWQRESAAFRREHPLCCCCKSNGVVTPSEVTDHVVPHRGDPVLLRDPANWQALCHRCHNTIKKRFEGLHAAGRLAAGLLRLDRPLPEYFDLSCL